MCGIVAAAGKPLEKAAFQKAINQIRHRGPDANGYYKSASEEVWLGHRRLSIVDLSPSGQQPMHNEDQTIWLICNGEIYNYFSLRPRLEKLGHVFYSNSDNEVILHAYETWGENLFNELEGMFSFVLWDEKKQQLFAARDRVGIKPLYYSFKDQHLLVASEASAMLPLFKDTPSLSPMALAYLLSMGYIPAPYSIWSGIHKLESFSHASSIAHPMPLSAQTRRFRSNSEPTRSLHDAPCCPGPACPRRSRKRLK